jgi:LmbE family N-acetylglucosaminyl deacetylase
MVRLHATVVMKTRFPIHPRAWLDSILTYPRYLGTIKPELLRCAVNEIEPRLNSYFRTLWPKRLEAPVGQRLLVLSPHPDDESIGCGGLLLLHKGKADIHLVNIFNGDGGGSLEEGEWRDESTYKNSLVELRKQELDRVAAKLGAASVTRFNLSDCIGVAGAKEEEALRALIYKVRPDVVLLPWFLDNQPQHNATNTLFAKASAGYNCCVLAFEIWTILPPNSFIDITNVLDQKLNLIREYSSQLRTVDYVNYALGLSRVRAFSHPVDSRRSGAVESYLALPSREYCELSLRAHENR